MSVDPAGRDNRGTSPHYQPASPNPREELLPRDPVDHGPERVEVETNPHVPANTGVCPIEGVSEEDATSFAMTSQYWAGYWTGVAQSMRHSRNSEHARENPNSTTQAASSPNPRVVLTRRDFGHTVREGLRR